MEEETIIEQCSSPVMPSVGEMVGYGCAIIAVVCLFNLCIMIVARWMMEK